MTIDPGMKTMEPGRNPVGTQDQWATKDDHYRFGWNACRAEMLNLADQEFDAVFLDGMRAAATLLGERCCPYHLAPNMILEEVARRAKSGNVRQKTGLAERSDAEASATPSKQGDAS